jgi:hypothetical protein
MLVSDRKKLYQNWVPQVSILRPGIARSVLDFIHLQPALPRFYSGSVFVPNTLKVPVTDGAPVFG